MNWGRIEDGLKIERLIEMVNKLKEMPSTLRWNQWYRMKGHRKEDILWKKNRIMPMMTKSVHLVMKVDSISVVLSRRYRPSIIEKCLLTDCHLENSPEKFTNGFDGSIL